MQDEAPRKKRAVNLSIDSELLDEAKAAGTNLSAALEKSLREDLGERRWKKWREDNREAIEASNAELDQNGMWYTPDWLRK
jgi:antitoxin CcdA